MSIEANKENIPVPEAVAKTALKTPQKRRARKNGGGGKRAKAAPLPFDFGLPQPLPVVKFAKLTFKPIHYVPPQPQPRPVKALEEKKDDQAQTQAPPPPPAPAATDKPEEEKKELQPQGPPKVNDPRVPKTRAYWKQLKDYTLKHGCRRYVQFIVVVGPELRVLLFKTKVADAIPGGALLHDEDEQTGLKRVWKDLFHMMDPSEEDIDEEVEFKDVIAQWYRPELTEKVYPYKSRYIPTHKEHIKTYLVQLKKPVHFRFPDTFQELTCVDIYDIYDHRNPEISAIPNMLSRYDFKCVE